MVTNISPPISLSFAHAHYAHACGATWIIRRERIDLTPLRAFKARELRTHFAPIIAAVESVVREFRWITSIFNDTDIALHKSFDRDRIFSCNAALYSWFVENHTLMKINFCRYFPELDLWRIFNSSIALEYLHNNIFVCDIISVTKVLNFANGKNDRSILRVEIIVILSFIKILTYWQCYLLYFSATLVLSNIRWNCGKKHMHLFQRKALIKWNLCKSTFRCDCDECWTYRISHRKY